MKESPDGTNLIQRPLNLRMARFPLDDLNPISDRDTGLSARLRAVITDMAGGDLKSSVYTSQLLDVLHPQQGNLQSLLTGYGKLLSFTLVWHGREEGQNSNAYRVDFQKAIFLIQFFFNYCSHRIADLYFEDIIPKS